MLIDAPSESHLKKLDAQDSGLTGHDPARYEAFAKELEKLPEEKREVAPPNTPPHTPQHQEPHRRRSLACTATTHMLSLLWSAGLSQLGRDIADRHARIQAGQGALAATPSQSPPSPPRPRGPPLPCPTSGTVCLLRCGGRAASRQAVQAERRGADCWTEDGRHDGQARAGVSGQCMWHSNVVRMPVPCAF